MLHFHCSPLWNTYCILVLPPWYSKISTVYSLLDHLLEAYRLEYDNRVIVAYLKPSWQIAARSNLSKNKKGLNNVRSAVVRSYNNGCVSVFLLYRI
jgi:hypothetical protein